MAKYIDGDFCINIVDQSDLDEGVKRLIKSVIRNTKTADVVEVKHGKWIQVDSTKCKCSNCDVITFIAQYPIGDKNFCPNCGANMKGGAE